MTMVTTGTLFSVWQGLIVCVHLAKNSKRVRYLALFYITHAHYNPALVARHVYYTLQPTITSRPSLSTIYQHSHNPMI